jgi:hypothetical protein
MTAIALFWTPDEIIVATDSKVITSRDEPQPGPLCKIHQENAIFFTFTGFCKDDLTGFDTEAFIREACRTKGTFLDKVEAFHNGIQAPLTAACQGEYELNRKFFNNHLKGMVALEVVFFGVSEGELAGFRRAYQIKLHGKKIKLKLVEVADIPDRNVPGVKFEVHMLPDVEAREKFIADNALEVVMADPVDAARRYIETMIASDPEFMGPPIDILSVTKSGAKWIQRKDNCPDIKPFKKPK